MPRRPSADVEGRILGLAVDAPRQARLPARLGRGLAAGLVVNGLAVAVHPRSDLSRLSLLEFTVSTSVLAIATALIMAVGTRSRAATGPRVAWLTAIVVGTTPVFAAVTLLLPLGQPPAVSAWTSIKGGLGCLATLLAIGGVSLAGLLAALRRAVPVAPRRRGAALGAAAGALGGLAMHLRCPSVDPLHIAVGHVGPILLLTLVGAVVGPRFLRP